ncbi:MAG: D-aminoacyl-tRNA deacylase [Acidobacteriota bacterium]
MRAVVQRVTRASALEGDKILGEIGRGLMVLVGIEACDTAEDALYLAQKIVRLRIFEDPSGKMNLSLGEVGGQILVVSQFTLLGDCRRGNRPSFANAAEPAQALTLYEEFLHRLRDSGADVKTGRFQARMEVRLSNDGPVTILVDSKRSFWAQPAVS